MTDKVQIIEHDGKPAFAVVPIELWQALAEQLEDAQDVAAFDRAMTQDEGSRIPHAVLKAEINGTQPVRAWREHRAMSQAALAAAAGVSRAFICQIEAGDRTGSIDTLAAIARALDVSLDLLQPFERS